MALNLYSVLGISRTATADGIRRAFRERALKFHPDRAGPAATEDFQRVAEAYEILSNAAKRAAYDRLLARNAAPRPRPASASAGGPRIDLDLILSREEAFNGGAITVGMPIRVVCPHCRGAGQTAFFHCRMCVGRGTIDANLPTTIRLPPDLTDGMILRCLCGELSIGSQVLRMLVRVR